MIQKQKLLDVATVNTVLNENRENGGAFSNEGDSKQLTTPDDDGEENIINAHTTNKALEI